MVQSSFLSGYSGTDTIQALLFALKLLLNYIKFSLLKSIFLSNIFEGKKYVKMKTLKLPS